MNEKKKLAVERVDHKKAYNTVPRSWIVECFSMVGMSEQIKYFLFESMKAGWVDLTCNN